MFEGSNRHFDQTLCMGLSITDEDIDSLCQSMKEQAVKNANNEVQKESVKEVGRQQLRSWGILIERDGPIWEQIEQAFQYVLRNIHLGANIVGIYRQDVYEIPPDAIRELIINAAVHRSYLDHGNIQVAIYDDRLEITAICGHDPGQGKAHSHSDADGGSTGFGANEGGIFTNFIEIIVTVQIIVVIPIV